VRDRAIPAFAYVVLPYALAGFSIYTFKLAWDGDLRSNAIFAAINGLLYTYAIVAFIGVRNSLVDVWINVVSWLYTPQSYK
jgi:cellulose synthase (UDP-forming)